MPAAESAPDKRLSPSFLLAAVVLLTALTGYWLFGTTAGLGGSDWAIQPNPRPWDAGLWLLPVLLLGIFGLPAAALGYFAFYRASTAKARSAAVGFSLTLLSLFSLFWPWALFGPAPAAGDRITTVISSVWSEVTTHFFELACHIDDPREFSATYAALRQHKVNRYKSRIPTHPPGATLFYYAARRSYEASPLLQSVFSNLAERTTGTSTPALAARSRAVVWGASGYTIRLPDSAVGCALWCTFLISLAVMAAIPAVYLLGAGSAGNQQRGLLAAALFAFAPSVGLYGLGSDALITCGSAWTVLLFARYLERPSALKAVAAGALLALTSFVSFGALTTGFIVLLAAAWFYRNMPEFAGYNGGNGRLASFLRGMALFGAGFIAGWALLMLAFPMQPLLIYRQAMEAHHFATLEERGYWNWVAMDPVVFAVFAGWTVSVPIVLAGVFRSAVRLPDGATLLFARATLVTVALLSVSGKVRGEAERLWMFLLPPLCVLAAEVLIATLCPSATPVKQDGGQYGRSERQVPRRAAIMLGALLGLQALHSLMSAAALTPLVHHEEDPAVVPPAARLLKDADGP